MSGWCSERPTCSPVAPPSKTDAGTRDMSTPHKAALRAATPEHVREILQATQLTSSVDVDHLGLADDLLSFESGCHVGHVHGHSHRHLVVVDVLPQKFQRGLFDVPHQPWSRKHGIELPGAERNKVLGGNGEPSLVRRGDSGWGLHWEGLRWMRVKLLLT